MNNVIGFDNQHPLDRAIDWSVMRELKGGINAANDNFKNEEDKTTASLRLEKAKEAYKSTLREFTRVA